MNLFVQLRALLGALWVAIAIIALTLALSYTLGSSLPRAIW